MNIIMGFESMPLLRHTVVMSLFSFVRIEFFKQQLSANKLQLLMICNKTEFYFKISKLEI